MPVEGFEGFSAWLDDAEWWTISQFVEDEWTDEQVVADWVTKDGQLAYLQVDGTDAHLLTITSLIPEPDDDGWKLVANGSQFSIGYVWTNQQEADLARWKKERPTVVPARLAELIG